MKVRLLVTAGRFPVKRSKLRVVVDRVCKGKKLGGVVEVSLSLVDESEIKQLNQKYMGRQGVTDVLSFPLEGEMGVDGVTRLGDVVICYPQAVRQAKEHGLVVTEEIESLLEHGLLHLLGEDHD